MTKTFEEIYAPATEPLTVANNANQALYKNHREWREYARALKEQNEELKAIVSAQQVVAGKMHSDEEFQELKKQHEIELSEQRQYIKSQLEELKIKSLPVIPQFVADYIINCKANDYSLYSVFYDSTGFWNAHNYTDMSRDTFMWIGDEGNDELFTRSWLDGYTVEQEQLFYLRNKLTGNFLAVETSGDFFHTVMKTNKTKFTQQEIARMEVGSYDIVPVESEGE